MFIINLSNIKIFKTLQNEGDLLRKDKINKKKGTAL